MKLLDTSMKLLTIFLLISMVAACQTTGGDNATLDGSFIERYNFPPERKSTIREYLAINSGRVLAISEKKGILYYRYYLGTEFTPYRLRSKTFQYCAIWAKEPCVVLAIGNVLSSKGIAVVEKIYGKASASTSTGEYINPEYSNYENDLLCMYAVTLAGTWETRIRWGPAVKEAKSRGLTQNECARLNAE